MSKRKTYIQQEEVSKRFSQGVMSHKDFIAGFVDSRSSADLLLSLIFEKMTTKGVYVPGADKNNISFNEKAFELKKIMVRNADASKIAMTVVGDICQMGKTFSYLIPLPKIEAIAEIGQVKDLRAFLDENWDENFTIDSVPVDKFDLNMFSADSFLASGVMDGFMAQCSLDKDQSVLHTKVSNVVEHEAAFEQGL